MNDQESLKTYESLAYSLTSAGLGWLVEEVAAEIRHGKPEQRKLRVRPSDEAESVLFAIDEEPQRRATAKFVGSAEYTPKERLNLLLTAIDRATVQVAAMEQEAAQLLARSRSPQADVTEEINTLFFTFKPEQEGAISRESSPDRRRRLQPWSAETGRLICELKEVTNANA